MTARVQDPSRPARLPARAVAAEAFALREWGVAELLDGAASPPPAASVDGWQTFLTAERCAAPLLRRLEAGGRAATLPAGAESVLRAAALRELQRSLSARGQLQRVASFAAETGRRYLVMKGGVALLAGAQTDVLDVDVLSDAAAAQALCDHLDARGFRPFSLPAHQHLSPRYEAGAVQVEAHTSMDGCPAAAELFATALPIAGLPGLLRASATEHLWMLLVHSAGYHPERRGRIRDLLLLRDALAACPPAGGEVVRQRALAHPEGEALQAVLARAGGQASARQQRTLTGIVRRRYLFLARARRFGGSNIAAVLGGRVLRLLSGARLRSEIALVVRMDPEFRSGIPYVERLTRRCPPAAPLLRRLARAGVSAVVLCLAAAAYLDALLPLPAPAPTRG
jgi:hypothetical protein